MWALEIIGYLLLGCAVIIGAVAFGLPYLIAKAAGHDQATCDCWDCRGRRHRAVEKAKARGIKAQPDPKDFWSTAQLATGRHVIAKGIVYRVENIRTMPDGSTKVGLQNVLTEVYTFSIIPRKLHEAKIWRKGMERDIW